MRDETTILGNLVKALDEARLFCGDASVHTTRPWLQRLLEQLAHGHQLIADELCTYVMAVHGDSLARAGGRRHAWRAAWLGWVARNHFDSDLACVRQAKTREDRLTRRFARAVRRTSGRDIRARLERHLYATDCARMEVTRALSRVQEEIDARWLAVHPGTRLPATVDSSRPPARERNRFEA